MQKTLLNVTIEIKSVRPLNKFRSFVYSLAKHRYFETLISVAVATNMFILCCEWYQAPMWFKNTLENLNFIFVLIFVIEAAIKIIGTGYTYYFSID